MRTQSISEEEKRPFLDDQSILTDEFESSRSQHFSKLYRPALVILLVSITIASLICNILLLLYPITSVGDRQTLASSHTTHKPYSPADQFVAYELQSVDTHDSKDKFTGPPGPDFDHAWSDLLTAGFMRIMPDELRHAGKQSLRIKDSEQESYLGYMEVYHQLHCVKRMVQNRWPDRYPELRSINAFTDQHFNHCIQVLRKGIMCNGDTSLNTFKWDKSNSTRFVGVSDAPRQCINWDSLDSWARSRATGTDFELYTQDEEGWLGPSQ